MFDRARECGRVDPGTSRSGLDGHERVGEQERIGFSCGVGLVEPDASPRRRANNNKPVVVRCIAAVDERSRFSSGVEILFGEDPGRTSCPLAYEIEILAPYRTVELGAATFEEGIWFAVGQMDVGEDDGGSG